MLGLRWFGCGLFVVVAGAGCAPTEPSSRSERVSETVAPLVLAEATLRRRVAVPEDHYSRSLDLSGNELLVGAPGEPDAHTGQGAVYAFFREGGVWEWTDRQRLVASDGAAGDAFGASVAIDGATALVGAPRDDDQGTDSGSVYLFRRDATDYRNPWTLVAKLRASDAAANSRFGESVALRGDRAVVGAPGHASGAGAAYVFARSGGSWQQQQKLSAPSPAANDGFGKAVAVDSTTCLIGAPGRDGAASDAGAAYVFALSGSTWVQQHVNAGTRAGGARGTAVAVRGDAAFVGAPLERADRRGSVSVLTRSGGAWSLAQSLTGSDGSADDGFGRALDVDDVRLVVGAPERTVSGMSRHGMVYAFDLVGETWTELARLDQPSGASPDDELGRAVAVSGDYAVGSLPGREAEGMVQIWQRAAGWFIDRALSPTSTMSLDLLGTAADVLGDRIVLGVPGYATGAPEHRAGAALVFERTGAVWSQRAALQASDRTPADRLGTSVALEDGRVFAGAPYDSVQDVRNAGSVHVFENGARGWSETATLTSSHPFEGEHFGRTLASTSDTLAVGAPSHVHTPAIGTQGAVFVFVRDGSGWREQAELRASDGSNTDWLGSSVAIEGDVIAAGAPNAFAVELGAGKAYIFERSAGAWSERAKLVDPAPAFDREFGSTVAVAGGRVFVGAPGNSGTGGRPAGSVYVYARVGSQWVLQQTLNAPNPQVSDLFGWRLAAHDGVLVATDRDSVSPFYPALHFFELKGGSWQYQSTQSPAEYALGGLAIDASRVVIGAPAADTYLGIDVGVAYVYTHGVTLSGNGTPCTSASSCASGFCVDGVCCDTPCNQTCRACSAALKAGASADGTCGPTRQGLDPRNHCAAQAPSTCGTSGTCDGSGACAVFGQSTACGATTCEDGMQRGRVCTAPGVCGTSSSGVSCAPYRCAGSQCATRCTERSDCIDTTYACVAERCVPARPNGEPCALKAECASGFCVDGACCDGACQGQCEACAERERVGTCVSVAGAPRGPRAACAGSDACAGTCNGTTRDACAYPDEATGCGHVDCPGSRLTTSKTCNGDGRCAQMDERCPPCDSDADCLETYECSSGACVSRAPKCKDAVTAVSTSGEQTACSPYLCVDGSCTGSCTISDGCAPGSECRDELCKPVESDAGGGADSGTPGGGDPDSDSGCACHLVSSSRADHALWLLAFAAVAAARRRTRVPSDTTDR